YCLAIGTLVFAGPYMAIIGGVTNKQSIRSTWENHIVETPSKSTSGFPLAVWWPGEKEDDKGWWGLWALGSELSRGMFHIGWPAALLGLWVCRQRILNLPGMWVLLLLCIVMSAVLVRLANVMGYLSDRHCLIILFCSMYWVATGFQAIGHWLARLLQPY